MIFWRPEVERQPAVAEALARHPEPLVERDRRVEVGDGEDEVVEGGDAHRGGYADGGEGGKHGVDDALGEPLVERRPAEHEAVVDGPEQQLVEERPIHVGAQVTALDPAVDEPVHLGDARGDDLLAEPLGEPRIGREVGDEPLHHAPHQRCAEDPHGGGDERDQLVARVVEVRRGDELLDHVDQHGEGQLVLGAPAAVDGRLGHTGARRDALDRQTVHTTLRKQLAGGVEDGGALGVHKNETYRSARLLVCDTQRIVL